MAPPRGPRGWRWGGALLLAALLLVSHGGWPGAGSARAAAEPGEQARLEQRRGELNRVLGRLQREQAALAQSTSQERSLLGELERLDRLLSDGHARLEDLRGQLKETRQRLPDLEAQVAGKRADLERQKRAMAAHLRLFYGLGEQGGLRLMLSQENPARMEQGMRYFGYLLKARQEKFRRFREAAAALAAAMEEHQAQLARLEQLTGELETAQGQRREQRQERGALLTRVKREKSLHQRQVAELGAARDRLNTLVGRLEAALASALLSGESFGHITRARGKLPPPVKADAGERPPGVFYRTREATPVNAIFRGQVVYADWFRGYGLLIIVDHGDRVFSLYGHNSRLRVAQGEWVEPGQAIADSGDTGSLVGAGLYFEMRHRGRAVNPKRWLASGGA